MQSLLEITHGQSVFTWPLIAMNQPNDCNGNIITPESKRLADEFDHLIPDVRKVLKEKLHDHAYKDTYYQFDLDGAMKNDFRIRRHIVIENGSVEGAVNSLITRFQWIKENKLREIGDPRFCEFHQIGAFSIYGNDLHGRPVLYHRVKLNVVNKELLENKKICTAYVFLKADDASDERGIVTVSDLAGTSFSALELPMANFIASLAKYFPYSIAEALVVNLPMLGHLLFNVVKWTFPKETRPKCISQDQLTEYIDVKNIPAFLGGECEKPYSGPAVVPAQSLPMSVVMKNLGVSKKRTLEIMRDWRKMIESVAKESDWWYEDLYADAVKQIEQLWSAEST